LPYYPAHVYCFVDEASIAGNHFDTWINNINTEENLVG
jgi:hypothetical protein